MPEQTQAVSCVIPPAVWSDDELSPAEKVLAGRIHALAAKEGYCWAGNSYLSEDVGVSERSIRKYLSALEERGHCEISYTRERRVLRPIADPDERRA